MRKFETVEEANEAAEDLAGSLQELHHRLDVTEDLSGYGVAEGFIGLIEEVLIRYDALD